MENAVEPGALVRFISVFANVEEKGGSLANALLNHHIPHEHMIPSGYLKYETTGKYYNNQRNVITVMI